MGLSNRLPPLALDTPLYFSDATLSARQARAAAAVLRLALYFELQNTSYMKWGCCQ